MTTSTITQCAACGAAMRPGLFEWHFVCNHCKFEKSSLTPKINEIDAMDESARLTALKKLRQANFATLLNWLDHQYPSELQTRPLLLEVGCAHGWFMEQAQKRYDVEGIEPDKAIASATSAKGLRVRQGFFPDVLNDADVFDIIIFNDVLEHIPDVQSTLRSCHDHLSQHGHVVVNAPDSQGIIYRLSKLMARLGQSAPFERMWQVGLPSPHLYYFDTQSITRLATSTGFEVEAITALPSIEKTGLKERIHYAGSTSKIQSIIMAFCIRMLLPLIRMSRPDIRVWLLRKQEPGR